MTEPGTTSCADTPASLPASCQMELEYRKPFDFGRLLAFFRYRELAGVESIDDVSYSRTVRMTSPDGETCTGWIRISDVPGDDSETGHLLLQMSESLLPVKAQVAARVRQMWDLDCNPDVVYRALAPLDAVKPGANVAGTRVPGALDPFEITVRAVLGQQVSVQAANKLAARIAEKFGTSVDFADTPSANAQGSIPAALDSTPSAPAAPADLRYLFPTAEDFLHMDPIEQCLGELGVIKSRSRTIRNLAELYVAGELTLDLSADVPAETERLLAVKGIGEWSQNYIAMRTMGYTDAFLEKDSGIKHALPGLEPKERTAAVEPCRPWRAYANLCLWNSLSE